MAQAKKWQSVDRDTFNENHGFQKTTRRHPGDLVNDYSYFILCSDDELESLYDWLTGRDEAINNPRM